MAEERAWALFGEAMSGAERIYRRAFPVKRGSDALIVDLLENLTNELMANLRAERNLLRQRALVTKFQRDWEKACAKEASA